MNDNYNQYADTPSNKEYQAEQFQIRYRENLKNNLIRAGYTTVNSLYDLISDMVDEKIVSICDLAELVETGGIKWI